LHGTTGNDSNVTRWSCDMRIKNSFAPVDVSARPTYYAPLANSPISRATNYYLQANANNPNPTASASTKEGEKWHTFKKQLGEESVTLGPYFTFQLRHTPRHILYTLSYHKFAAKMIGKDKTILDIGCSEGLGTAI